jgi:parallel beta-helix repeat protein
MNNGEGIYVGTDPLQAGGVPDRTRNIVIENNEVYNTRNEGIELKAGTSVSIVRNNTIHHIKDAARGAIHTAHWDNPLINPNHSIESNKIQNVNGYGIEVGSGGVRIMRNVVSSARLDAIRIVDTKRTRLVAQIYNNTLYNNLGSSLYVAALVDAKNNLSWANGSGNIGFDPIFANASAADIRLCEGVGTPVPRCPRRSPAIDAGLDIGLPFRGAAPDLGAEESGGAATNPLLTPAAPSSLTLID